MGEWVQSFSLQIFLSLHTNENPLILIVCDIYFILIIIVDGVTLLSQLDCQNG